MTLESLAMESLEFGVESEGEAGESTVPLLSVLTSEPLLLMGVPPAESDTFGEGVELAGSATEPPLPWSGEGPLMP